MGINLVTTGCCPLCKNALGHRLLFELDTFNVYECRSGHKFIDPSLDAPSMMAIYTSSETLKEINPALEQYYEYDTLSPQSRTCRDYRTALGRLKHLSPGRRLLEIGCGAGSFIKFAQEHQWEVKGLDPSAENIRALQAKGIDGVVSGFMEYTTAERYDVVVLWDLIEHPQDPIGFMDKSFELLKPGGLLLIAAPQDPNLLTVLAGWIYRLSFKKIRFPLKQMYVLEHTSYFDIHILMKTLEDRGFSLANHWKTETDLDRYSFKSPIKIILQVLFFIARPLKMQNRMMIIAQKPH